MACKMSGKCRRMSDIDPFKEGHNVRCLKKLFIYTDVSKEIIAIYQPDHFLLPFFSVVAMLVLFVTVGVIVCIRCVGTKKSGPAFHRLQSDDYFEDDYLNTPLGSKILFNREYRDDIDEEEEGDMSNGHARGANRLLTNEYHDATSDEEFTLPPGKGIRE